MTTITKLRFKAITSQQSVLFPSNLSERIRSNHPVRLVNQVVDQLNIEDVLQSYKGGGTSSYHPRVMIKILFYSYLNNIYSCRKIAAQLEENIHYMWLAGEATPNFRTINNFRSTRLKGKIQALFSHLVRLMVEMGYVSLETQYIDGTKIESAANRYSFVWRGSVEKYKEKLESKIDSVLKDIETSISSDQLVTEYPNENKPIDSAQLQHKISQLNKSLDKLNKKQQKAVRQLNQDALPRLKKYEKQLETLEDRNSFSKTDTDATFMRMKEDHMKNGQLKPAYNIQISTENQIITNFSLHRRAGDPATLIPHLNQFSELYNKQSGAVVADAGYGSEQNYEHCEQQNIQAYIKYNFFHKQQKKSCRNNPFLTASLFYNEEEDFVICPIGQKMTRIGISNKKSDLGFESTLSVYQAKNCKGCPLRSECYKGKKNRIVELNHNLIRLRKQAKKKLLSQTGLYHRSKRPIEPEAVFGQIKFNNKFNRFTLRGIEKVEIEFGLVAISHNLRKMTQIISNNMEKTVFSFDLCFDNFFCILHFEVKLNYSARMDKIKFVA